MLSSLSPGEKHAIQLACISQLSFGSTSFVSLAFLQKYFIRTGGSIGEKNWENNGAWEYWAEEENR